ncbi:MAG: CDP-alcohol phosphatidyltransferase family protein [Planctomycetes bacterium]|nr:CDP-alcohol phosphatidyltransferase family protein [Planctomycetota bacterium]
MPRRWLESWVRLQAAIWLPVLVLAALRPGQLPSEARWAIAGGMAASYGVLVVRMKAGRTVADLVTLARAVAILAVVAVAAVPATWPAFFVAVAAVAADLVDGAVARRWGGGPFGAELDMETDQFTVFGLAVLVVAGGGGVHALVLPAMKYAFVLAAWWLAIPASDPKPVAGDNRRGRIVCASVVVALLAALCPECPAAMGNLAVAVAVGLLAWSFAGDARWLWRHRRAQGPA